MLVAVLAGAARRSCGGATAAEHRRDIAALPLALVFQTTRF